MTAWTGKVDFRADTALCVVCPRLCRDRCPVASASGAEAATPSALMERVRLHASGVIPLDGDDAKLLWRCVDCGACSSFCELGQDPPRVLDHARRRLVKSSPLPESLRALDAVYAQRCGIPFEASESWSSAAADDVGPGSTLLWPGCEVLLRDPRAVDRAAALLEVVSGIAPIVPSQHGQPCCGALAGTIGNETVSLQAKETLAKHLPKVGRIVVLDANCLADLKDALGSRPIEVVSVARYLLEHEQRLTRLLANARSATGSVRGRTVLHPGCCSTGGSDLQLGLRRLLREASGLDPVEFTTHGGRVDCCGGKPVFAQVWPEDAGAMARALESDPTAKAAELIVTASVGCSAHLAAGQQRMVLSLTDYLAACLGLNGQE